MQDLRGKDWLIVLEDLGAGGAVRSNLLSSFSFRHEIDPVLLQASCFGCVLPRRPKTIVLNANRMSRHPLDHAYSALFGLRSHDTTYRMSAETPVLICQRCWMKGR